MGLEIKRVNISGVELFAENTTLLVKGKIDTSKPGDLLRPFLMMAHEQIMEQGIKNIKLDIRELVFLNSSAISEFSDWFLILEILPADKQYTIDIFCNFNDYEWQYSTMKTLQLLNPNLIKLH